MQNFSNQDSTIANQGNINIGTQINNYLNTTSDSKKEQSYKIFQTTVPASNPHFIDREEIPIELIFTRLQSNRYVALHGLGGHGKTQLASEYAHKKKDQYQHIFWINSDTKQNLKRNFSQIFDLLKRKGFLKTKDLITLEKNKINHVKNWLETQENCLVVFDNVESEYLSEIKTKLIPSTPLDIIITIQAQSITGYHALPVGAMSEKNAIELFNKLISNSNVAQSEYQNIKVLCNQLLSNHPLAIEQAASYIRNTNKPVYEYIDSYEKILDSADKSGSELHETPVFKTFTLCEQKLRQTKDFAAIELLRFLSTFHPDFIPIEILQDGIINYSTIIKARLSEEGGTDETLKSLLKYSLIKRQVDYFSMHRLVQKAIFNNLKEKVNIFQGIIKIIIFPVKILTANSGWLVNISINYFSKIYFSMQTKKSMILNSFKIINDLFPNSHNSQKDIERSKRIYPSYNFLILISNKTKNKITYPKFISKLENKIQSYIDSIENIEEKIQELKRNLEAEPTNIITIEKLAKEYFRNQEYEQALELFERLIILKPNHPEANYYLGNLHLFNKRYRKAIQFYNKAVFSKYIKYELFYERGKSYFLDGKYNKAAKDFEKAISLNGAHINSIFKHALSVLKFKKVNDATILKDIELLKKINPSFFGIEYLLSLLTKYKGDKKASKEYLLAATEKYNHIKLNLKLGNLYFENIEYDSAMEKYNEYIKYDETSTVYINKGIINIKKGLYAEALQNMEKAFEIDNKKIEAIYFIGYIFYRIKNFEKAKQAFEFYETKDIDFKKSDCLFYLGKIYRNINSEKSIKYFSRAIKINRSDARISLERGNTYFKLEDYEKSLKDYMNYYKLVSDDRNFINFKNLHSLYERIGRNNEILLNYKNAYAFYVKARDLTPANKLEVLDRLYDKINYLEKKI